MNDSLYLVECYSSDGYTNRPICPSFLTTKEQADKLAAKCGPIFAQKYWGGVKRTEIPLYTAEDIQTLIDSYDEDKLSQVKAKLNNAELEILRRNFKEGKL